MTIPITPGEVQIAFFLYVRFNINRLVLLIELYFRILYESRRLSVYIQICIQNLQAADALGLMLYYFGTTCTQRDLCVIFGITEGSLSKYLKLSVKVFLQIRKDIPECVVEWPNAEKMRYCSRLISAKYPKVCKHDVYVRVFPL